MTIFNLDDAIANKNNPLYTINIPDELHYLQGFFLDDGYLYWYTGDTNSKSYPNLITVFDSDNKIVLQKKLLLAKTCPPDMRITSVNRKGSVCTPILKLGQNH